MSDAPNTPTAADAPPLAAAAPEPLVNQPDGGQRIADPRERAVQKLLAKRAENGDTRPVSQPELGTVQVETVAPIAAESTPIAEEKAASRADDAREAKLLAEMQKREKAAFEASRRAKELEAELAKALEAAEGWKKKSPLDALKDLGYSYEDLTRGIVEGKFKPATPEQMAIEGTKSEVQQLREQLAALQAEQQEQARQSEMTQRTQAIAAKLSEDDVASKIPLVSSMPWAAQHLADYHAANPDEDLDAYAMSLESRVASDLRASLVSERALKALLADASVKGRVMAILGVTKTQDQAAQQVSKGTADRNPPTAIPQSAATAVGSRKTPSRVVSDLERKANALRAVMERRAQKTA